MISLRTSVWPATGLVAVALVAGWVLPGPSEASAGEFGQHVRLCAQQVGFDGTHNPGMHRGASHPHSGHHC